MNVKRIALAITLIALAGCQASFNKQFGTHQANQTYQAPQKQERIPLNQQGSLAQRNLALNAYQDVILQNRGRCDVELVGHRGFFKSPENSLPGITRGLAAGFDTVELDIYRLRDGNWVLHHDQKLGRSSDNDRQNRRTDIERFNSRSWQDVRLRDPETTLLQSDTPAPFLNEAVDALKSSLKTGQQVNFEIKSQADLEQLAGLDLYLNQNIPGKYYYSSPYLDVLRSIRAVNKSVYLGLVAKPHPKSIEILRATLSGKNDRLGVLDKRQTYAANKAADYLIKQESQRENWLTKANLNRLASENWGPFGVHADIRYFMDDSGLSGLVKSKGFKLQTYTINDTNYHLESLELMVAREGVPDGVIIDSMPYAACQRLADSVTPNTYSENVATQDALIKALPADADFDSLDEQMSLYQDKLYLKNDGSIAAVLSPSVTDNYRDVRHVETEKPVKVRRSPGSIKDGDMSMQRSGPILIDLRSE